MSSNRDLNPITIVICSSVLLKNGELEVWGEDDLNISPC